MLIEETAANVDEELENQPTSPVEKGDATEPTSGKEGAKAFSEKLKKEKLKIREEEAIKVREDFAISRGYNSYAEMIDNEMSDTIEKTLGQNPDDVKKLFDEFKKKDPEFLALKQTKAEIEKIRADEWANSQLREVNEMFGESFKTINELELSEETQKLWEEGKITLDKAVKLDRDDLLEKKFKKVEVIQSSGKDHLRTPPSSGSTQNIDVNVSDEELEVFRRVTGKYDTTKQELIDRKRKRIGG